VFTLDVTFGFKGVIDGPEGGSAPDVCMLPLVLLLPLPVIPVRVPIPVPLLPDPVETVGAATEAPLNENEMAPKAPTTTKLWFAAANVPN
jgi:hypothetical protein